MKKENYAIYRLYNREQGVYTTEFFLPDDCLDRKLNKMRTLSNLKDLGYHVLSIYNVDKETYLNYRLSESVDTYLYQDRAEQEVEKLYADGMVSEEVYTSSLTTIKENKQTYLKLIGKQVRRLLRQDFDVNNEIAIQLYDYYRDFI